MVWRPDIVEALHGDVSRDGPQHHGQHNGRQGLGLAVAAGAVFAGFAGRRAQSQSRNTRAEYVGTRLDSFSNQGVVVAENTDCGLAQHKHDVCANTQ